MHRVRVFLNGAASSSRSQDWRGEIQKPLFRSRVEFVTSGSREEFEGELRRAAEDNVDAVISVGGDGTFNTVLQGLATSKTSFLVVPAGTANDLARELGISKRLKRAVECIRRNEVSDIDLLSINGRYMATNGGIGIVSDVALHINGWRNQIPGFRSLMTGLHHHVYSLGLAGHLLTHSYRYYHVRVESKEFTGDVKTPLLFVNNQPYIAGSFPVAPETNNSDGTFNVTIFVHPTWTEFMTAVVRVQQHLPLDHDKNVISFETAKVTLLSLDESTELSFFGDGEELSKARELEVKIHPKALRVFRPGDERGVHAKDFKGLKEPMFL